MQCDFERDSFDCRKNFRRVLQQQGRVHLAADWNEQVSILWEYSQNFVRDLVGPHAGPDGRCGFGIVLASEIESLVPAAEAARLQGLLKNEDDFLIGPGSYYVDGLLCNNHDYVPYSHQPDLHQRSLRSNTKSPLLIYLDVWERHISWVEDDSIREVALAGADTASRAKMVWQVKHFELTEHEMQNAKAVKENWDVLSQYLHPPHRGRMRVKAKEPVEADAEPCTTSPQSRYRGPENQLYRVEIHHPGPAGTGGKEGATFKWSRENASVIFPIVESVGSATITLQNLGRDVRSGLEIGDWVEVVDDEYLLENKAEPLLRVDQILDSSHVILSAAPSKVGRDLSSHPYLRRWDQKEQKIADPKKAGLELHEGAVVIHEGGDGDKGPWILLEDGIQVQFNSADPHNHYRTGDYWLVPARTATGDVIWPHADGKPAALPPRGVQHHYAPLGILEFRVDGITLAGECRMRFSLPVVLV